jgi:hypothetical protein
MPNNMLDDQIAFTLQTDTVVTPDQKARAWEVVRARANEQTMLAPISTAPVIEPAPSWQNLARRALAEVVALFVDDRRFCRAAYSRCAIWEPLPQHNHLIRYPGTVLYMGIY